MSEAPSALYKSLPVRLLDKAWLPPVLCILLIGPATWSLTQVDYFSSHDGDLHRWRIWEFWQIWQSGQVPVRWSPDLVYGFGSPVFAYYNPLAYLIGAAMQGWGLSAVEAAKLVYGGSLVLMALGMYVLSVEWYRKQRGGGWAALIAAVTCLYAPYVLANVYQRGAMAEALALGLVPWVLWTALRSLRRRNLKGHLGLALSVAMLILSHNLVALMLAPVLAAVVFGNLVAKKTGWTDSIRAVGKLLLAVTLGLAISAWYLMPVAAQLSFIQVHQAQRLALDLQYPKRFIAPAELVQALPIHDYRLDYTSEAPGVPHLGLVQATVVVAGLVAGGLMGHWRRPAEMILLVGIASALFMVTPASRVVWDFTPSQSTLQFPWRFLGVIAILGGLVAGRMAVLRMYGPPVAFVLIIAMVVAGMWVQVIPKEWPNFRGPPTSAGEFERRTGLLGLTTYDEYLPTWVRRTGSTLLDPTRSGGTDDAAIDEVVMVEAQHSHWRLETTTPEPTTMTFDAFYFPTWRATIDGWPAETHPISELGLLGIDVPAGNHRVEVYQAPTDSERVGLVVSLCAVLVAGGLWIWKSEGVKKDWPTIATMAVVVVALVPLMLAVVRPRPQAEYRSVAQGTVQAGGIELLGARLDQGRLGPTGILDVELSFISAGDPPDEMPMLWARLVNAGGQVVAESRHVFGGGVRPSKIWQPNMLLSDRFELELPSDAAAGEYELLVGFLDTPLRSVGSFSVAEREAKQTFDPSLAPSGAWRPVLWGQHLMLDRFEIRQEGSVESDREEGSRLLGKLWLRLVDEGPESYEAVVRLLDGQGAIREESKDAIQFPPGETLVTVDVTVPLPADLPPGTYRLELLVRGSAGGVLPVFSERGVVSPAKSLLLWTHYVPRGGSLVALDMDDGLRIFGYEREVGADMVDVTVYWQAREKIKWKYTSFIHLLDREGRLIDQYDAVAYDGGMPTTQWEAGRVVPFAARLRLPEGGGPFRLRAGMYEFNTKVRLSTADGGSSVSLGLIEDREPPHGSEVEFTGGVRLLGHRLGRDGDRGLVTLYWQTSRRLEHSYSVFVHVLDSEENIVAQGDGLPEMGERTSEEWPPGEVIVDPHWFEMPAERPLRVRVGLYRLDDGSRLATVSGDDKVDLGVID